MMKYNPENERIKREYFSYLKEAKRYSEPTLDAAAKALSRFEDYTRYRAFKLFHVQQAIAFKRYLAEQIGQRSGEKLSKATLYATLTQLKRFFFWLAGQPGFKTHLQYSDAEYFSLSEKDTRIATTQRERKAPTLEQVRHVIGTMPHKTEIEQRNRALVAFTIITGARDSAIASMKLKHIDLAESCVHQDAREVNTKFSKSFPTYFFPVGDEIENIVADWICFLRSELLWSNDDPLFPATQVKIGESRHFEASGLGKAHWSNANPIRTIFRKAFSCAGLPYFNPHSLRSTLSRYGQEVCKTPEEYKAWSQNLGHEKVLTTFMSYGSVTRDRQGEIIRRLALPLVPVSSERGAFAKEIVSQLLEAGFELRPIGSQEPDSARSDNHDSVKPLSHGREEP